MRAIILIFLLLFSLYADVIEAKYKVTYGLFGKVGNAEAKLIKNKNRYKIVISAKSSGFAKILSNNRKEHYISEGYIENGILVPEVFKKVRENSYKKDMKEYRFDHKNRKVYVHVERYRDGKLDSKTDELLKYYAKDDILSLYFNLNRYVNFKKIRSDKTFYAVGGNRKDGRVDVEIPKGDKLKKIKNILEDDGFYLIVTIYQKIFSSKEGRLYIVMNEKGITKKAVLKDVILFGDITGELKDLKIKNGN